MRASNAWLLCGLLLSPCALAQTADQPNDPQSPQQQMDQLRAIQEKRAELLRELRQLRERLSESDARMEATRERVRQLESQQTQPVQDQQ